MIIFNKNPSDGTKLSTSLPKAKVRRRLNTSKNFKKITKENKEFLRSLGFNIQNAANHRFTTAR